MTPQEKSVTHGLIDTTGSFPRAPAQLLDVCSVPALKGYWKIKGINYLNCRAPFFLPAWISRIVHDFKQLNFFTSLAILLEDLSRCLKNVAMIALSKSSNEILNSPIAFSLLHYSPCAINAASTTISMFLWSIERFNARVHPKGNVFLRQVWYTSLPPERRTWRTMWKFVRSLHIWTTRS